MAALTWRDVIAPNYQGVQQGINGAAELLSKSTTGLSGALTQFGDQQALQQLAKYSDAQKLQADIQSGRFNTANASPEALAAMMNRPAALLTNAANQQTFDYDAQKNPLELSRMGIANATSQEALNQSRLTNPLVVNALQRADDVGAYGQANRLAAIDQDTALNKVQYPAAQRDAQYTSDLANLNQTQQLLNTARTNAETNRAYPIQEGTRQAQEQVAMLQNQGQLPSPVEGNAYFQQLVDSGAHPVVLNAVKGMLEQSFGKGVIGAVSTSVGGSVPSPVTNLLNNAAGGGSPAGSSFDPVTLGNAIYGQESSSGKADTTKVNSQNVTGPMQVQEATFEGLKKNGIIPANYDWKNPEHNKAAGFAHIADLAKTYKTPQQVAAVYYSGPDAVNADGTINLNRKNPERPNDPTVGQYIEQVMARTKGQQSAATGTTASTVLASAATPTGASATSTPVAAKPVDGESTDIFGLRRKLTTLTTLADNVERQDATGFNAAVLSSPKGMSQSAAITELRKDPAFSKIAQSTIVEALEKARGISELSDYGPLIPVLQRALGSGTEFNFTGGEAVSFPWRSGTFDYDKLESFAQQAGDLKDLTKSADGVAQRKDALAQVSFLMPKIEALNAERINLYQQKQMGKPGADAALAKVDERIKGYMAIINPEISKLDKDLNARVKNSSATEKELTAAANKKIAEDAAKKANETALLNQAKAAEQRKEATRIAFENAPPEVRKAAAAGQIIKAAEDKKKAATLLAQKQKDQATLQGLEWLTPETAVYADPKLAALILDDPEKERLLGRHITRILANRLKN